MGRPPLEIDEKLVLELAKIHCTMIEIASVVGCSVDTLERRFADTIKNGKEVGKSSLRRSMFSKAHEGNPTMLIWLSKQHLGMRDGEPPEPYRTKEEIAQLSSGITKEEALKTLNERRNKIVPSTD